MSDSRLQEQIERAIREHTPTVCVAKRTTNESVAVAVRDVMRESPDIFWFSHQWKYVEETATVVFYYTISKEKAEKLKAQIEDVVANDFHIARVREFPVEAQLMYVYKWIALYCQYNVYAAYHQTICSVFVYRNSVCTGYAKAAQYLLNLLGIKSHLMFGKMHNSAAGTRHCWLVVKAKDAWYHYDPTFAAPSIKHLLTEAGVTPAIGADGLVYNFFCVDSETIRASRTIEDEDTMPLCTARIETDELQKIEVLAPRNIGCLISEEGSTSKVYLYHSDHKPQEIIKVYSDRRATQIARESSIASALTGCPHLLSVRGTTPDGAGLLIEQATPLADLLCCHYYKLTIGNFCRLLTDILDGVCEALDRGYYYRDLHINNIYRDIKGCYKLGDYGSCCRVQERSTSRYGIGSEWYMAPETFKDGLFDEHSATYGVGMVAYFLLNDLYPPLWRELGKDCLQARLSGKRLPLPQQLQRNKGEGINLLGNFLSTSLAADPSARMSIKEMRAFLTHIEQTTHDDKQILIEGGSSECMLPLVNGFQTTEDFQKTESAVTLQKGQSTAPLCVSPKMAISTTTIGARNAIPFATTSQYEPDIIISNGDSESTTIAEENIDGNSPIEYRCSPLPAPAPSPSPFTHWRAQSPHSTSLNSTHRKKETRLSPTYEPYIPQPIASNSSKHFSIFRLFRRKKETEEKVYSSVFAPSQVKRNANMLVQVYLHLQEEAEKMHALAQEADKDAERRDYLPLRMRLKHGDEVDIELTFWGAKQLHHEKKTVVWHGAFTKCSFRYFVPSDLTVDELNCEINIYVNSVIVGEMNFLTTIMDAPAHLNAKIKAKKFDRIFISYAHQDIEQVKKFAIAYSAQGVDYFFDRHSLNGGDIYEEKIFDFIDHADLFLLCWSKNAEQSDYVPKEIDRALTHAYPQVSHKDATLKIFPISMEPHAPFPSKIQNIYNIEEL